MHRREDRVDVAPVERGVEVGQEPLGVQAACSLPAFL
jgi:hypothetical protein